VGKGLIALAEMVRVNTRISKTINDWLDEQSKETGVPKSTIVMLALENYYREKEMMKRMADMGAILEKLETIEDELAKVGKRS
jgi:predicted DNA-binding protein